MNLLFETNIRTNEGEKEAKKKAKQLRAQANKLEFILQKQLPSNKQQRANVSDKDEEKDVCNTCRKIIPSTKSSEKRSKSLFRKTYTNTVEANRQEQVIREIREQFNLKKSTIRKQKSSRNKSSHSHVKNQQKEQAMRFPYSIITKLAEERPKQVYRYRKPLTNTVALLTDSSDVLENIKQLIPKKQTNEPLQTTKQFMLSEYLKIHLKSLVVNSFKGQANSTDRSVVQEYGKIKEIWKWYEIKLKYCQNVLSDEDALIAQNLKKVLVEIKKLEVSMMDDKSKSKNELHRKKLQTLLKKFKQIFTASKHYFYC